MENSEGKLKQLRWVVDGEETPIQVSSIEEYHENEEEILGRARGDNGKEVVSCSLIPETVCRCPYKGEKEIYYPQDAQYYIPVKTRNSIHQVFLFKDVNSGLVMAHE
ncbi:hypothetical protein J4205_03950 [Candidatus Pacearchaeota archaeon]|nr:hypothetical protein [Candidatus Pacearchaeota archaeon]